VVLLKESSPFEAIPVVVAIRVAPLYLLDYCAHSDLLFPPFAFVYVMAKDGEVACWFQPFMGLRHGLTGAVSKTEWPTP
jgi:hypothetical protein